MNKNIKNTLLWGFVLWFAGYLAGVVLFFAVPKDQIGWYITPFAVILTVWVLLKKVKRSILSSYFEVGLIWTIMAVLLDYLFLVLLFNSADYYKFDVYLYYFLTLLLPFLVGYYKIKNKTSKL